jgi:RNA recognition motif-containing protein
MATNNKRKETDVDDLQPSKKPAVSVLPQNDAIPSSSSALTKESSPDPCNLFVKHLPPEISDEKLRKLFSPWGEVVSARVMRDPETGLSLGYGFVKYSRAKEAKNAMTNMQGFQIDNKHLLVKHADISATPTPPAAIKSSSSSSSSSTTPASSSTMGNPLYTAALQQQTQSITQNLQQQIQEQLVSIYGDALPKEYLPYYTAYYVQLYTQQLLNPASSVSVPNNQWAPGTNLFIFHLPPDLDDAGLYSLFKPFGEVLSVKVMTDKMTGVSKGFGFVKFKNYDDAMSAINTMNGYQIGGKYLKVTLKSTGSTM